MNICNAHKISSDTESEMLINPLDAKGNYSATSNNTKLVHWPLMGGLLHLARRGLSWLGTHPVPSSLYQM